MSVTIPPQQLMLLRSLKKTAVLLFLFRLVMPRPLGRDDVARFLDISENSAARYLDGLALNGLIARAGYRDGYILTAGGMQLFFDAPTKQIEAGSGESSNFELSGTLVVEDLLINTDIVDSSSDAESSNFELSISLKKVLEYAPALFDGNIVSQSGLERIDPMDALRWMAYAWTHRNDLDRPCGFIYARLKKHVAPPKDIDIHDLPENVIAGIGMWHQKCDFCEQEFTKPWEYRQHLATHDDAADESQPSTPEVEPNSSVTDEINQIWQNALLQLQEEMPRASFDTWVRDTAPVAASANMLTIGARNEYACKWLDEKLASTIERLLENITGRGIAVNFVIGVSTETENDYAGR